MHSAILAPILHNRNYTLNCVHITVSFGGVGLGPVLYCRDKKAPSPQIPIIVLRSHLSSFSHSIMIDR